MTADDKIEPLGQYRGIRPLKEGNVFAKLKIKKKLPKKERKTEEDRPFSEKDSGEHKIDIEA